MALNPATPLSSNALQEANLLHSPQSPESKERVKWEAQYSAFGPGLRPYVKREYPMMLHQAGRPESGMGPDTIIEQLIIDDEREYELYRSRGFRETPLEALEAFSAQQLEFAKLAANLEYQKKNQLSPRAAAEVEAAQDASPHHLPMVPETPIRPRAK
jgi:hypothetical protein